MTQPARVAPRAAPAREPLRLLSVGGPAAVLKQVGRLAEGEGVHHERVPAAAAALRALTHEQWSAVLVAHDSDPDDQLEWWVEVLSRMSHRPRLVPMITSPSMGFALRAAQGGVFDVLPLPVNRDRFHNLVLRLQAAVDERTMPLPPVQPVALGSCQMVSESGAMLPVFRAIAQAAPSTATVLIEGDSGTGKELTARALHLHGPREAGPFVAVNCAAIPENLLESELFGHEKGAFTSAVARRIGRFERANGGTLFLDEIGDMSLALQGKILRAVQEREIERVGGTEPIPIDVRLIAATNQDLKTLMAEGRFREDLYYRLAVVTIKLPSLADRGDDVAILTAYFLREFGERYGKSFSGITDRALELLARHEWEGNVRELRNVIERAVLVAEGDLLRAEHLPEEWRTAAELRLDSTAPIPNLREVEARHITRVMMHADGQIGEAARLLGVHRNTLARKIREYGV